MKRLLSLVFCLLVVPGLVGCAPELMASPTTASQPAATEASTATPPPVAVDAVTATPQPPDKAPAAVPTEDLVAQVTAGEPEGAFTGYTVLPLVVQAGARPLWAVISTGMRNWELTPPPCHFVAIYTYDSAAWQQLARMDLDSDEGGPDYVDGSSAQQVDFGAERIFLEIPGGAGAHGGTYQLLSFDSSTLRLELAMSSPSPGMGSTTDLNGDGALEVVLDQSGPYIFCYACGARKVQFQVLRWDDRQAKFVAVDLQPLPADEPASVRQPANRAVELARAGLWKEAYARITEARNAAGSDVPEILGWDYTLIRLHAEALQATLDTEWPLIQQVFYGDYAAAVDILRAYKPEEIWRPDSPLVADPLVEPFIDSLSANLVESATHALEVEPGLAAAWFIRGWGEYLADPASAQARADVVQAASLAPDDALYVCSVAVLQ